MPASNTETKLPTFNAGESLIDQLTETVMRALTERIKQGTPVSGKGISVVQTAAGTIINLENQRPPIGMRQLLYSIGTTYWGSNTHGPAGSLGNISNFGGVDDGNPPWGGSTPAPITDDLISRLDEWDRDLPPLDYTNQMTTGVYTPYLERIYTSPYSRLFFRRGFRFDSRGALYHINENGSAPLEIRMHPWQTYISPPSSGSVASFTVYINTHSTLWAYDGKWGVLQQAARWDRMVLAGYNVKGPYTFTASTDVIYIKVLVDRLDFTYHSSSVVSGARWANWPYVLYDDGVNYIEIYQLLCYLRPKRAEEVADVNLNGSELMLINTTHTNLLVQIIRGINGTGAVPNIADFPAIMPWYACFDDGS